MPHRGVEKLCSGERFEAKKTTIFGEIHQFFGIDMPNNGHLIPLFDRKQ